MAMTTTSVHPYHQRRTRRIVWRQRYDGLVTVAYRGGIAIAGISGPWSDRFVLTWWAQQYAAGSLELFDSLDAAQAAVAQRVGGTDVTALRHDLQGVLQSIRGSLRPSWLARIGALFFRTKAERIAASTLAMRHQYLRQDTDLTGIHFDAYC